MHDSREAHIEAYADQRPLYQSFAAKLEHLLRSLLEANDIKFQVVESRAKTIESFSEKITRTGKTYIDPLKELPDLCGCRIITYYADDVGVVADIIKREFEVIEEELSHQPDELEEDRFGYLSAHYIVRLGSQRKKLAEWKSCQECHAEIQIRTVIQHAWSAVSHLLQYKQQTSIPSKLRRRLFRIAGLFELADEEFVGIRDQRSQLEKNTAEELAKGNRAIPLTSTSIQQMILNWRLADEARDEAKAAGFYIYEHGSAEDLIPEIYDLGKNIGFATVQELEDAVEPADFSVLKKLSGRQPGDVPWGATDDFLFFLLLLAKFPEKYTVEEMLSRGWTEEVASRVLDVVRQKK